MGKPLAVCFVDDDRAELDRFKRALGSRFDIGIGTNIEEALGDLKTRGRKKPDLFALDMYFPEHGANTESQLDELKNAWDSCRKAQAKLRQVLGKLGQSPNGGWKLAADVRSRWIIGRPGVVFFTRKGTLEDAVHAYEEVKALSVLKKPDPSNEEQNGKTANEAYDAAMMNPKNVDIMYSQLRRAITQNTWWYKNKTAAGYVLGIASSFAVWLLSLLF